MTKRTTILSCQRTSQALHTPFYACMFKDFRYQGPWEKSNWLSRSMLNTWLLTSQHVYNGPEVNICIYGFAYVHILFFCNSIFKKCIEGHLFMNMAFYINNSILITNHYIKMFHFDQLHQIWPLRPTIKSIHLSQHMQTTYLAWSICSRSISEGLNLTIPWILILRNILGSFQAETFVINLTNTK
mgnify:CR=1 FL=1